MKAIDFFISHASEDKQGLVKKLADNLILNGALVFYDEYSIKLGDSIYESINKGLSVSKHAILILSKHFFEKGWTNAELQAIFTKSLADDYKIFIIYHEVNHAEVKKKYPLLADEKAIESSVGVEKITESLFNAVNKPFQLGYIKHDIGRSREIKEGISISMFVGFPNRLNTSLNKTLYEMGNPEIEHTRIKMYLWKYSRLFFQITDSKFRKYSISVPFDRWVNTETHFIHACLDVENNMMQLIVDDDVFESISVPDLFLDKESFKTGTGIIGCSLELTDPCPFIASTFSTGTAGIDAKASYTYTKKLIEDLKRGKE